MNFARKLAIVNFDKKLAIINFAKKLAIVNLAIMNFARNLAIMNFADLTLQVIYHVKGKNWLSHCVVLVCYMGVEMVWSNKMQKRFIIAGDIRIFNVRKKYASIEKETFQANNLLICYSFQKKEPTTLRII